jgi:hypothetical protein
MFAAGVWIDPVQPMTNASTYLMGAVIPLS